MDTLDSPLVEPIDEPPVVELPPVTELPQAPEPHVEPAASETQPAIGHRDIAEWHGRLLIDRDGERIGKLEHVYFDVETEEPQFGTVKEGLFGRQLALIPLAGATIGPDSLHVLVSKEQIRVAPKLEVDDLSQADESRLYHHYELNYTPLDTDSGRRLARR
jgi:PRC-barrel domain